MGLYLQPHRGGVHVVGEDAEVRHRDEGGRVGGRRVVVEPELGQRLIGRVGVVRERPRNVARVAHDRREEVEIFLRRPVERGIGVSAGRHRG